MEQDSEEGKGRASLVKFLSNTRTQLKRRNTNERKLD